jgi:hypothetical protein
MVIAATKRFPNPLPDFPPAFRWLATLFIVPASLPFDHLTGAALPTII